MIANVGELARIVLQTDNNGTAYDPSTLVLLVVDPSGTISTFNWPSPADITHDALGQFHYDFAVTIVGTFSYRWIVGGLVTLVIPGTIEATDPASTPMPRVMISGELDACIGAAKVDQLFDDNGDALRDPVLVAQMLRRAEDFALSYMLSSWADEATCIKVMKADAVLRMNIAWVACEYMSERRPEFLASDGKGQFWAQYTRAEAYFVKVSTAALNSVAEATAGHNAQSGGVVQPALTTPGTSRFVFAPDKNSPSGHGGF